eukprot:GHVR01141980.1.p1 GENE.GHVR01141980.1~~GHVR01141980.1.p1  ORF type:complete len:215 (+),score=43.67 GHVR01141980.1:61-705(+)
MERLPASAPPPMPLGVNELIKFSKGLVYYLRHDRGGALHMSSDAYVKVNDIIKLDKFKSKKAGHFTYLVAHDDKDRFGLKMDLSELCIRCNQGHSKEIVLDDEKMLSRITDHHEVRVCIHGTSYTNLKEIYSKGLRPMNRRHVHFISSESDTHHIPRTAEVGIYINLNKAMKGGIKFYKSDNNVILCGEVIGHQHFHQVKDLKTKEIVNTHTHI